MPDSLRQVIERQLERLPEDTQHLLEAASAVGVEFSAASIAAGLRVGVEEIERQCETLARKGQFIRAQGTEEWPDGTLGERYRFLHTLYHAVLYERITETQRVRLHRRIGERKEAAYGEQASEIAAELAMHFEAGRETQKAVHYCRVAGEKALRRHARREAVQYLNKGLAFLSVLPESPERARQELAMQVALGDSLITTKGYAAPETEHAYRRAWELCQQGGDTPQLFPTLAGLRSFYAMRGEQRTASEIEEQLFTLARQAQDSAQLLWAHLNRGTTLVWLGAFVEARTHLEQGVAVSDPGQPRSDLPLYGNPAAMGWSHTAMVLWALGYPDRALQKSQQAQALADEIADP